MPRRAGSRGIVDDLRLARRLRAARFDVVLDLHGGPRSSWLTWATGAPQRIGYDIRGAAGTTRAPCHRPRELRPRHSVVNQWDLLWAIDELAGAPRRIRRMMPVEMPLDPAADAARRRTARCAPASTSPAYRSWSFTSARVIPSGAGRSRLSSGSSAALATADDRAPHRPQLGAVRPLGRRSDRGRGAARARPAARQPRPRLRRHFDLAELRALIERSRLFVGGDTGPLHIAATTRTPIVGIYGPTLAARSAPWRDPALATESVSSRACRAGRASSGCAHQATSGA